jgi:RNA-dependent RNA polymerase
MLLVSNWAPVICFDLRTPAILEKEDFYRQMTGNESEDNRKFRQRLIALDPAHERIAPYAHHIRLVLVDYKDIAVFAKLCEVSKLPIPVKAAIDASQRRMFSNDQLQKIRRWVVQRSWSVAWQIELLLHNYLVNTEELLNDLYVPINQLYDKDPVKCGEILRNYVESLQNPARPRGDSALACFKRVLNAEFAKAPMETPPGMFPCHHITFTPTRLILEGPYAIQSNRVIRRYPQHQGHFIRVDFRDEDRLQYRWDREVDGLLSDINFECTALDVSTTGSSFLHDRVGLVLKNGFEIAGR